MAGGGANDDDTKWMNDKIADFLGIENERNVDLKG